MFIVRPRLTCVFFYVETHGQHKYINGGSNQVLVTDISVMARALPPPIAVVQRRVVVTGLGAVTPLANGMQASWERLLEGKCGIRQLRPSSPDSPQKVRGDMSAGVGAALQLLLIVIDSVSTAGCESTVCTFVCQYHTSCATSATACTGKRVLWQAGKGVLLRW